MPSFRATSRATEINRVAWCGKKFPQTLEESFDCAFFISASKICWCWARMWRSDAGINYPRCYLSTSSLAREGRLYPVSNRPFRCPLKDYLLTPSTFLPPAKFRDERFFVNFPSFKLASVGISPSHTYNPPHSSTSTIIHTRDNAGVVLLRLV